MVKSYHTGKGPKSGFKLGMKSAICVHGFSEILV